jgi:hypothetical protein
MWMAGIWRPEFDGSRLEKAGLRRYLIERTDA